MTALDTNHLYLAIDQGGHASRALVFDKNQQLLAQAAVDIETTHPQPHQVEHDPEALVRSIQDAITGVVAKLGSRAGEIHSAGLATQRSSIVCWDRQSGVALSPVISWQDRRAADWLESFRDRATIIHARTGLVLSPHYGASKLRWCLDHLPEVSAAQQQGRLAFGPLASFLLFRLLEERPLVADPANAARTQLWDIQTQDWSSELMDWFGIPIHCLPSSVPSYYLFGTLSLGDLRVPLRVTTGDQPAAMYATGKPDPDNIFINMGTGAFVQRISASLPSASKGLLRSVILRKEDTTTYSVEGTVNGAGSALRSIAKQLGLSYVQVTSELDDWLKQASSPPLFMNGVSGLGSPYWISDFPSMFVGDGETWEKMVAVVESIVFLLQVNIEQIVKQAEAPKHIIVSGGLSNLSGLVQRLADISGLPVLRPLNKEATALGLANLLVPDTQPLTIENGAIVIEPEINSLLQQRYQSWCSEMDRRAGKVF